MESIRDSNGIMHAKDNHGYSSFYRIGSLNVTSSEDAADAAIFNTFVTESRQLTHSSCIEYHATVDSDGLYELTVKVMEDTFEMLGERVRKIVI